MIIIDGEEYHRIGRTLYRRLRDYKLFRLSAKGITANMKYLKLARLTEVKGISISDGMDIYGLETIQASIEVPREWSFVPHCSDGECQFCGREK